jgi:protein-L-isoaspartate(D-aspartate) O-methyltransferase
MTESLELSGKEKVLEIGSGSGYQAAILAELARWVITVERLPALAKAARSLFDSLGYKNVKVHVAEPTLGWPAEAPYDAIIVTAGAPKIPDGLLGQMVIGGRLVVPVGSRYEQELYRITKGRTRNVVQSLGDCRFVPLIGEDAWQEE